jgi:uncharacterized protein YeaO (DUF488 family)
MVLRTKQMNAPPEDADGMRICIMRDARVYNRQLKAFHDRYGRPMYDLQLKELAPSLVLKREYLAGQTSWEEYVPHFTKETLETQEPLIDWLASYALYHDVTLLCSEPTPEHCHRRLVAERCRDRHPALELLLR